MTDWKFSDTVPTDGRSFIGCWLGSPMPVFDILRWNAGTERWENDHAMFAFPPSFWTDLPDAPTKEQQDAEAQIPKIKRKSSKGFVAELVRQVPER
jgi:hypothetical protein